MKSEGKSHVNVRKATPTSRVMVVAIMVSMVAFLDGSVVNLALPSMAKDLGGGLTLQQWVVDAYLLAFGALVLPGGSISDLIGRVPVMRFGLVAFGVGSTLAAVAPSPAILITARSIQGLGGAFLVPGSLALINSAFDRAHQPAAIGSWTGWTGTAIALGPLLGGLTVDFLSWRWIYALSAIPMVIGFALTFWLCPVRRSSEHARVDFAGAVLSAVGFTATVYALIESQRHAWTDPVVAASILGGLAALLAFVLWQRRAPHPLVPLQLFAIRNFAGGNLATALIYGGLSVGSLTVALYTQEVAGYSATAGGLATVPIPIMSFLFAKRVGAVTARSGPWIFLISGPALAAVGLLLIRPNGHAFNVVTQLLPGITLLATGMVATLTPLTSISLSAVEPARSGIGSAINSAVSRLAGLMAVACMGLIAAGPLNDASFARLMHVSAVLLIGGAVVGGLGTTNPAAPTEPISLRRFRPVPRPAGRPTQRAVSRAA